MKTTILMGVLFGIMTTIAVATTSVISAAYADNNDNPSDDNVKQNFKKHRDRVDSNPDLPGDGNLHNDDGQQRAADNIRDNF